MQMEIKESILEEVTPELECCSLNRRHDGDEKSISDSRHTKKNIQICKSETLGTGLSSATYLLTVDLQRIFYLLLSAPHL